jgi:acetyl esterase/lipase
MIYKKFVLAEHFPALQTAGSSATLSVYARDLSHELDLGAAYPAVLICPGGGYEFTSDREAEPVAMEFLAKGYQVFVVRYSVAPAVYPAALTEAAAALLWVRRHAEEYHVDPGRVLCMGFSAGGHLAGSLGMLWDEPAVREALQLEDASALRPDALCLCYPVITSGKFAHRGSFDNLLGERREDQTMLAKLSLENAVRPDMPPVFLWHTADDDTVPVQNSLMLAAALKEKGVPFELHVYASGPHGLSLASKASQTKGQEAQVDCHIAGWTRLCDEWMQRRFS